MAGGKGITKSTGVKKPAEQGVKITVVGRSDVEMADQEEGVKIEVVEGPKDEDK